MRARFRLLPEDADLAALSIERFTAVLETILVFSTFYLIQQWFAARGFFERAIERPGSVGTITTHQGWVIATVLGLIILPIVIRRLTDGWKLNDFGFIRRPGRRDLTLAAFLGVALGLWFAVGFWLRPAAFEDARSLLAIRNWYDAAFYVGYVAFLAAAFRNEFFFRGYVQRLLTEEYGIPWGSFLALLFFWASLSWIGLNHVLALMVPLGIVSALLFNRRGSLYGPLLCHALAFGLGFIGYALLELTPGGYAWYTAVLALIVVVGLRWMRVPMLVMWRDLKSMVVGLESKWLRNGVTAIVMIAVLKVLWWTADRDLFAHTVFTAVFALVFVGYKTRKRRFELRRVLEP
jgi:membrane protease YdiL (CAAX protease family)